MKLQAAQTLYEAYKEIYEEQFVENCINQDKFFLNSLEVEHYPPFNDSSYELIVYAIKEGKIITFKMQDAIRLFGKSLK